MGIFDKLFRRKGKVNKGNINRIEICFNSGSSPYSEPKVIKDLIKYFDLADSLTPDVHITTSYGHVPGVADYLSSQEMPDELIAFVIARAMIVGIIHDSEEIGKIITNPFKVEGTLGILIFKGV